MKQILTCYNCGKTFHRRFSLADRSEGKPVFCSRACVNQYHRSSAGPRRILAEQLLEMHPDWPQAYIARQLGVSRQLVNKWVKKREQAGLVSR